MPILSDNQACIVLAKDPVAHSRTKHIDVRYLASEVDLRLDDRVHPLVNRWAYFFWFVSWYRFDFVWCTWHKGFRRHILLSS